MKPASPKTPSSDDLFRTRLDQIINMRHELVRLSERIDWDYLHRQALACYADVGRRGHSTRLMAGLHLLKHMTNLSDEAVCERWVSDPYFQYFCGEDYFQHDLPLDRSSMTYWRRRVGEGFMESLLQESLRVAYEAKALKKPQLKRVVVDTTVQPKAVAFPVDSQLRYKALLSLVELAKSSGIQLRQSYVRVCKRALVKSGRYRHAKQLKRANKQERFIQVRLGRVIRDIKRRTQYDASLRESVKESLRKADMVYRQERHSDEKLYSWHAPEVECIGKGKADKPYEFGCKVSVAMNVNPAPGGHFVLHTSAYHGNPYDGHTLADVIAQTQSNTGIKPERVYVDKGYRGHGIRTTRVYQSGQKRGVVGVIKKELKRRSAVEPIIGHLKAESRLGRNYLSGELGDRMNALLAACGFNFKQLLRWFRILFAWIKYTIVRQFTPVKL